MKKITLMIRRVLITAGTLLPLMASAQLPPGNAITFDEVDNLVRYLARFIIGISLTIAVVMIVWSGITMMAAQSNPTKFANAGLRLHNALIGIGVVMATGVLINTVAAIVDRSFFCQVSVLGICLW
ncbi:MAG: hypothetical protein A3C88_00530 [Candidatus Yanofskybacteria bacterium RIFCSPHIGHO2_02_FULL_50_12]|uniref:Uncharacterized protein n=1 Tax=Candidatus Yanofskybacteria bacterium RIFCSPHIGHO2_02_FULL_50_12 TaxID=1802685 RepID=A0A1F8FWH6_9BACT|nr:MAG: hypothetical protein A3C88_00530 [Candidatus Yanofskybacteria bacterium RIFCSPHIGHO2_02_FULL_50_12]